MFRDHEIGVITTLNLASISTGIQASFLTKCPSLRLADFLKKSTSASVTTSMSNSRFHFHMYTKEDRSLACETDFDMI